jgi:uncharacterized delta-60 repeat protein
VRRLLVAIGIASALLLVAVPGSASPTGGRLDRSFGTGGIETTPVGESPSAAFVDAMAPFPGGKTVAVGLATAPAGAGMSAGVFAVARYQADGRPDRSFGSGGATTTDFGLGGDDLAQGVAVQPDGKLVVVGNAADHGDTVYAWAIARYDPDGSLDPTFGTGGLVVNGFGGLTYDFANAVALEPDGKVVVAGTAGSATGTQYLAVARYDPDGSLDPTFGTGGVVLTQIDGATSSDAYAVALFRGEILVAGDAGPSYPQGEPIVAAYTPAGALDPGFGTGGVVSFSALAGSGSFFDAIAVSPRAIVAAGEDTRRHAGDFLAAELTPGGRRVGSFGSRGIQTVHFSKSAGTAYAVGFDPLGRIVLSGDAFGVNDRVALARLAADGALDSSFGSRGEVVAEVGPLGSAAYAMTIQSASAPSRASKIVVAGIVDYADESTDFLLVRYLS